MWYILFRKFRIARDGLSTNDFHGGNDSMAFGKRFGSQKGYAEK